MSETRFIQHASGTPGGRDSGPPRPPDNPVRTLIETNSSFSQPLIEIGRRLEGYQHGYHGNFEDLEQGDERNTIWGRVDLANLDAELLGHFGETRTSPITERAKGNKVITSECTVRDEQGREVGRWQKAAQTLQDINVVGEQITIGENSARLAIHLDKSGRLLRIYRRFTSPQGASEQGLIYEYADDGSVSRTFLQDLDPQTRAEIRRQEIHEEQPEYDPDPTIIDRVPLLNRDLSVAGEKMRAELSETLAGFASLQKGESSSFWGDINLLYTAGAGSSYGSATILPVINTGGFSTISTERSILKDGKIIGTWTKAGVTNESGLWVLRETIQAGNRRGEIAVSINNGRVTEIDRTLSEDSNVTSIEELDYQYDSDGSVKRMYLSHRDPETGQVFRRDRVNSSDVTGVAATEEPGVEEPADTAEWIDIDPQNRRIYFISVLDAGEKAGNLAETTGLLRELYAPSTPEVREILEKLLQAYEENPDVDMEGRRNRIISSYGSLNYAVDIAAGVDPYDGSNTQQREKQISDYEKGLAAQTGPDGVEIVYGYPYPSLKRREPQPPSAAPEPDEGAEPTEPTEPEQKVNYDPKLIDRIIELWAPLPDLRPLIDVDSAHFLPALAALRSGNNDPYWGDVDLLTPSERVGELIENQLSTEGQRNWVNCERYVFDQNDTIIGLWRKRGWTNGENNNGFVTEEILAGEKEGTIEIYVLNGKISRVTRKMLDINGKNSMQYLRYRYDGDELLYAVDLINADPTTNKPIGEREKIYDRYATPPTP